MIALIACSTAGGERRWAIAAVSTPGARPELRAIGTRVTPLDGGAVGMPEEARRRLGVDHGQKVWLAYG